MERLKKQFFEIPTLELAEKLLGKIFVRKLPGNVALKGRIVETEAYSGTEDEACHAWRGKTRRNRMLFQKPGTLYVYFTYGTHYLLNIVSEPENSAGGVLLRAMEPMEGLEIMQKRRGTSEIRNLMSGPGKLTQALSIDCSVNGMDLFGDEFFIEDAPPIAESMIGTSRRVGISRSRELRWRRYIRNNPHVSKDGID